jgi:hypothetical protein
MRVSNKKQELPPSRTDEFTLVHIFSLFMMSYYVSMHSEFRVVMSVMISPYKTMFGSSLSPVVCWRAHVLFTLFVFAVV